MGYGVMPGTPGTLLAIAPGLGVEGAQPPVVEHDQGRRPRRGEHGTGTKLSILPPLFTLFKPLAAKLR